MHIEKLNHFMSSDKNTIKKGSLSRLNGWDLMTTFLFVRVQENFPKSTTPIDLNEHVLEKCRVFARPSKFYLTCPAIVNYLPCFFALADYLLHLYLQSVLDYLVINTAHTM